MATDRRVRNATDPLLGGRSATWSVPPSAALVALLVVGIGLRVAVLPQPGLVGDLDQFTLWVHGIAVDGFTTAYDQNLSFPPVMAWIWGVLAAVEPTFRTATDASDPGIRILMKVPASLTDIGLAGVVAFWFRDRPWSAVAAFGAILLWPATWYISAWWGQYESIYVLPAALMVVAARAERPAIAAALLMISVMTKPQALPFVVPFGAWLLGRYGTRDVLRSAASGLLVVALLWLPFIPAGGPLSYLENLRTYQDDVFSVLSLRAWNPWWLVQEAFAGGQFVTDTVSVAGPISFRLVGLLLAALFAFVVFVGVYRNPSPERLAIGLAAISLAAFVALTTMHERYAYPALVFLMMAIDAPRRAGLWLVFAVAFAANVLTAVPPGGVDLSAMRWVGILGAIAVTGVAALVLRWTTLAPPEHVDRPARPALP